MIMSDERMDRRQLLQGTCGLIALVKLGTLTGCGESAASSSTPAPGSSGSSVPPPSSSSSTSGSSGSTGGTDGGGDASTAAGTCELYPEQTAGPFYVDHQLVRKDITEGKQGVALTLIVKVLDADACTPIAGAIVDVWHNDAGGVYSDYPGQVGGVDTTGQKFLRGLQTTSAAGLAEFTTIYPGWYPGRTTHIHFKVHLGANALVTSQMYFPDDANAAVYASGAYAARGQKDTSNAAEGIVGAKPAVLLALTGDPTNGYVATLSITVKNKV
jgi:protocatechuate 3,4-dioxygenase beta subunit